MGIERKARKRVIAAGPIASLSNAAIGGQGRLKSANYGRAGYIPLGRKKGDMIFKYLFHKIYILQVHSQEPNIFFPTESESQGAYDYIIGILILFFVGFLIAGAVNYLRRRNDRYASDEKPQDTTGSQNRRRYYRMNDSISASFRLGYREQHCKINDVSEGGVAFSSHLGPDKLKPATVLKGLSFVLPGGKEIVANAVVRRISPLKDPESEGSSLCGAEFVYISDSCREEIVRYVHSKQREAIRQTKKDEPEGDE